MSFILDALKKAESERNRRVAPVLMDARIAPPRRGLPGWVWALGAILLVNLGLLAWLLLREPSQQPAAAVAGTSTAGPPAGASAVPALPASTHTTTIAPPPVVALPTPVDAAASMAHTAQQVPAGTGNTPVAPADEDSLPGLAELQAAGVPLPELQLNLHVYDLAPAHRSVLLNSQRLREGEYTPDGVKVERITPQGVVLEAGGRRFRLAAGD